MKSPIPDFSIFGVSAEMSLPQRPSSSSNHFSPFSCVYSSGNSLKLSCSFIALLNTCLSHERGRSMKLALLSSVSSTAGRRRKRERRMLAGPPGPWVGPNSSFQGHRLCHLRKYQWGPALVGVACKVVPTACRLSSDCHTHAGPGPAPSLHRKEKGVARREDPAAAGAAA